MDEINSNISSLKQICKEHQVKQLFAFGSVVNGNNTAESDIDFEVEFKSLDLKLYFRNYLGLKEKLEKLFNKSIDLVESQTIKNPILRASINSKKRKIYG